LPGELRRDRPAGPSEEKVTDDCVVPFQVSVATSDEGALAVLSVGKLAWMIGFITESEL
jgi:hypothetical protein